MVVVDCNIEHTGFYRKLRDKTAVPDVKPARLNEDGRLYGCLSSRNEIDLNLGTEGFVDEGDGDKFESLFDYLKKTNPKGSYLQDVIDADFISNRRILIQFAKSAYVLDRLEIKAVRRHGVIFLCDTKQCTDSWEAPYPYGYKFEQCMTLDDNGEPHDKFAKVSNDECTKGICRATLSSENEKIRIFYAAELDAMDSDGNCVEIKTTTHTFQKWLKYKSVDHYLQSYLGNVQHIIYGYKKSHNEQVVYKVDKIPISEIPKFAGKNKDKRFIWNLETCLEKLYSILQGIKSELQCEDDAVTVRVTKEGVLYEREDPNCLDSMISMFAEYFD